MKLVLRIFNLLIVAASVATIILLFTLPAFTFNSNVGIDLIKLSKFVPESEYSKDIKLDELLGTDTIHVGIKFRLSIDDLHKTMGNDRDTINKLIISDNVHDIYETVTEPVNLITEYTIRTVIKNLVKSEVKDYIDNALEGTGSGSTADDIMNEVGLNEDYFTGFSDALYNVANSGATVGEATDVLYAQIDEAIALADGTGQIDTSVFTEADKDNIKDVLVDALNELKLINPDDTIVKVSEIPYVYFSEYLKKELDGKVEHESELAKGIAENNHDYTYRLLNLFVVTNMPDAFYNVVSYVSLGLFIGLFVFAGIWAIMIVFTLFRTLSKKKPWTFMGPLFWIAGVLEILLGLGLTIFGKFILPKLDIPYGDIPINSIVLAPRTYALVLSIVFIALVIFMIPYTCVKVCVKGNMKKGDE